MMKPKISPNLISFVAVRRGNWILKVSVFKSKTILVIARHYFNADEYVIRYFDDQNDAADFLDYIAEKE